MNDLPRARYEFRVFTSRGDDLLRRMWETENCSGRASRKSSQIYILAPALEHTSIKLRGDRLEVKEMVDCHGELQLWSYRFAAGLPVTGMQLKESLFDPIGVNIKVSDDALLPAAELLHIAHSKSPPLTCIEVQKARVRWPLDGCSVECAHIRTASGTAVSIALQSEDRDVLQDLIHTLRLDGMKNQSYISYLNTMR